MGSTVLLLALVGSSACQSGEPSSEPIVSGYATVDGTPLRFTESAHFHVLGARIEASAHTSLGNETLGVILQTTAGTGAASCTQTGLPDVGVEFTDVDGEYHVRPSGTCTVTVTNPLGDGDGLFRAEFVGTLQNGPGTSEVDVEGYLEAQDAD